MTKFMRIMVFFDLPVKTARQRKAANQFRKFLLKDGYHMVQFSVYSRICNGTDSVEAHKKRLMLGLPPEGAVRMMVVTERQYNAIEILVGQPGIYDSKPQEFEQMMLF